MRLAALDQHIGAVADGKGGAGVLFDQHDGEASAADFCRRAKTISTNFGDRPAEGSSSISTRGCTISARPTASICR